MKAWKKKIRDIGRGDPPVNLQAFLCHIASMVRRKPIIYPTVLTCSRTGRMRVAPLGTGCVFSFTGSVCALSGVAKE